MSLQIKQVYDNAKIVYEINGVLDISTAYIIEEVLAELPEASKIEQLILDFTNLEFIDSTGIGSIMTAIHYAVERQFEIKLENIKDSTREIFEMMGIFQIIDNLFQGDSKCLI